MHPKSFVGRSPPGLAWGAYSAPPDPLAGFKGPTSKKRKRRGEEGKERKGTGGKGRGGEGRYSGVPPLHIISGYATVSVAAAYVFKKLIQVSSPRQPIVSVNAINTFTDTKLIFTFTRDRVS